jgi:hypothetical protein
VRVYDLDGPSCVLLGVGEEWVGTVICASLNGDRSSARQLSLGLRNYQNGRAVTLVYLFLPFLGFLQAESGLSSAIILVPVKVEDLLARM